MFVSTSTPTTSGISCITDPVCSTVNRIIPEAEGYFVEWSFTLAANAIVNQLILPQNVDYDNIYIQDFDIEFKGTHQQQNDLFFEAGLYNYDPDRRRLNKKKQRRLGGGVGFGGYSCYYCGDLFQPLTAENISDTLTVTFFFFFFLFILLIVTFK